MNAEQIQNILATTKGCTFAQIQYSTKVATAAAHKAVNITKETKANVQLFNNLKEFTDVYTNAVKRSAGVDEFVKSDSYFEHTECFSIVEHKTSGKQYLFAIFNNAKSQYYVDGAPVTKHEVAQYLTKSAAAKLLDTSGVVYNATNDIEHTVQVRTIALENIVGLTANKQTI